MSEQRFPIKQGDAVVHKRWAVDVAAAARLNSMPVDQLAGEVTEMAAHFPRWLLTIVCEGQPVPCRACEGLHVFDRGARCVQCDQPAKSLPRNCRAGWFGLMPPIGIDGLAAIKDALVARPPRRHVVGRAEALGHYVLVPLVACYAADHPKHPVDVYYLPEFRQIPGVPRDEYSHAFHMIGTGRMCLFAPGDWHERITCREVLQQRAYPHVIKFLNYANGKRDAFAMVSR
jgi:hypothetical protein